MAATVRCCRRWVVATGLAVGGGLVAPYLVAFGLFHRPAAVVVRVDPVRWSNDPDYRRQTADRIEASGQLVGQRASVVVALLGEPDDRRSAQQFFGWGASDRWQYGLGRPDRPGVPWLDVYFGHDGRVTWVKVVGG